MNLQIILNNELQKPLYDKAVALLCRIDNWNLIRGKWQRFINAFESIVREVKED